MNPQSELAREVRRLAGPAILHSLLQTLVFVVDRVMLGRHGDASLAAMQIGGSIEWSLWSVFAAFEVGTIARVGRHVGAGDRPGARRAVWLSLGVAVTMGIFVSLATPLVLWWLPTLAHGVSADALHEARGYLGVTIAATPFVFVAATSTATLQAGGDTKTPLAIGIVANLVHIALNRVLILGFGAIPALGARGAGVSTAVTFAIEAALATLALTQRSRPVSLRGEAFGDRAEIVKEIRALVRIGGPAFLERVLYHCGFMVYAFTVTRLGDAAMAANQSLISVESICFLSGDGFGVASAALVAQKVGAAKPLEARKAASIAARYAVVTLTLFGLVSLGLRDLILPIFSGDPVVVAIGRATLPVLTIAQPFMAIGIVLSQSLRGAGRTKSALAVSFTGAVFVRLFATWFFTFFLGLGLVGVWLGSTTDWFVRAIVLVLLFRRPLGVSDTESPPAVPA